MIRGHRTYKQPRSDHAAFLMRDAVLGNGSVACAHHLTVEIGFSDLAKTLRAHSDCLGGEDES